MTDTERIDEQAARWTVRTDAGALDENERRQLEAWREQDARHRGAYARAQAGWTDLGRLTSMAGEPGRFLPATRRFDRRLFLAAGVAALAVAGVASWFSLRPSELRYTSG